MRLKLAYEGASLHRFPMLRYPRQYNTDNEEWLPMKNSYYYADMAHVTAVGQSCEWQEENDKRPYRNEADDVEVLR